MRNSVLAAIFLVTSSAALAQPFDEKEFIRRLNEALKDDGVIVNSFEDPNWTFSNDEVEKNTISMMIDVPEFAIGAYKEDSLISVFGPSAPFKKDEEGNIVGVEGFIGTPDTKFRVIGADEYAAKIQEVRMVAGLDDGVQRAISSLKSVTTYIATELCSSAGRPTEITLNLSADFKLVFGASTGTSAKWVMEETCRNFER